jgi:hypothetical protein
MERKEPEWRDCGNASCLRMDLQAVRGTDNLFELMSSRCYFQSKGIWTDQHMKNVVGRVEDEYLVYTSSCTQGGYIALEFESGLCSPLVNSILSSISEIWVARETQGERLHG